MNLWTLGQQGVRLRKVVPVRNANIKQGGKDDTLVTVLKFSIVISITIKQLLPYLTPSCGVPHHKHKHKRDTSIGQYDIYTSAQGNIHVLLIICLKIISLSR